VVRKFTGNRKPLLLFALGAADPRHLVEYRPNARITLNLSARISGLRTFYAPDRAGPPPNRQELRRRNRHMLPALNLKHSFG